MNGQTGMAAWATLRRLRDRAWIPLPIRTLRDGIEISLPVRILIGAVVAMNLAVLLPVILVRAVVVLPIALLAPGYAVLLAAFGARSRLDAAPRLALSVLLSMALYPLLALLLYTAAIRIETASVLLGTDVLILLLAGLSVLRMQTEAVPTGASITSIEGARAGISAWSGVRGGALFAAIAVATMIALGVVLHRLPAAADQPFTQFYLSGRYAHSAAVAGVQAHQRLVVTLGITNRTHRTQAYRVVPQLDNGTSWPGTAVTLADGRTWIGAIKGYVLADGCVHRLAIALRVGANGTALSPLTLWVRSTSGTSRRCAATSGTGTRP